MRSTLVTFAACLSLTACAMAGSGGMNDAGTGASSPLTADVRDPAGRSVATARFAQEGDGVRVRLDAAGLAAGTYAAHVHMVGRCDAPAFESAGAHWNPTGQQHGRENPAGAHLGDLPNLIVAANGRGSVSYIVAGATLADGPRAMRDADGSALLIHANPDDYRTDPSGNSGGRIACGTLG